MTSLGKYGGIYCYFFLGVQSFLYVDFMGTILTFEHAMKYGYRRLWLENTFILICFAFYLM